MISAKLTTVLFSTLLVLATAGSANAGPVEDAATALETLDYKTAFGLLLPLAEHGNASVQFNLGLMYFNGQGTQQDYAMAMKWFRLSAGQGGADAMFSLGLMYYNGFGVPQDYAAAKEWFGVAAEQGNAEAQTNLGWMYDMGYGIPQFVSDMVTLIAISFVK